MQVSPFEILADFDIIFKDGTSATADALTNDFWSRNFAAILQSDKLGMFNAQRIFQHMARLNGAKNVGEFIDREGGELGALLQPDQDVMADVQKGNLIPMDEFEQIGTELGGY